jgi:RNA recognition motif-containing protein
MLQSSRPSQEQSVQIYIGNIPPSKTEEELLALFSAFGGVASVQLIRERGTGKSRGFGFVEMPSEEEAHHAIAALSNSRYDGRLLRVNEARPANPRPPRDTW